MHLKCYQDHSVQRFLDHPVHPDRLLSVSLRLPGRTTYCIGNPDPLPISNHDIHSFMSVSFFLLTSCFQDPFPGVGASTICLFEHRHQCVLPTFHVLRHSADYRIFQATMYYLFAVFHIWLPVFVVDIEDKNLIEQVFDVWRDAPCDILNEMTVVLSPQKLGFLHFYYMGGIALVIILSFFYIAHSFYIIRATRILLSKDMQKIQRSFLKGLLLQVIVWYPQMPLTNCVFRF